MKKHIIALNLVLSSATCIFSQDVVDTKAKGILDELSVKTKTYSTIKADFSFTIEYKDKAKKGETQKGNVELKGEKYKLAIKGQDVISDGKTVWTYLKDANEVQVNTVDPKATDAISPSNIFTMYEKGYKYKFEKEEMKGGSLVQVINLYPLNPDKKKFHTVKLSIDKNKKQIVSAKMMMKDGSTYTYSITSFVTNQPINETDFTFDPKSHPGAEIVDLRE